MIKSMTGFGRSALVGENKNVVVEIKTVNNRYLDINVRSSKKYIFLEEEIKNKIKEKIKRGKLDVFLSIETAAESENEITLNMELAKLYYNKLEELGLEFKDNKNINTAASIEYIASLPDVIKMAPKEEDEEEIRRIVLKSVEDAVANLDEMRSTEGEKLAQDLICRGKEIYSNVTKIEKYSEENSGIYVTKMTERIKELIGNNIEVPADRILLEAAILADKASIAEEVTRLNSHLSQLENILTTSNEPVGKKLDFLVQEMNRETNTIGSKANNINITNIMLEVKSEIEKIREQVQNIE